MTRDEILAMVPSPELDTLVGKAIGAVPEIIWYAMNGDETSYSMDFNREGEAKNWQTNMITDFPNGRYVKSGGHIVRKEVYPPYSKDMNTAWGLVEKMDCPYVIASTEDGDQSWVHFGDETHAAIGTAPEAICKAVLLAVMEVPK